MKLDIGEVVGFGDSVAFSSEVEMCADGHEGGRAGGPVGGVATDARRGAEAGGSQRRFRSLMLGWTDPDSGDRLTARIRGGAEMLHELEGLGFEVLEDAPGSADESGRTDESSQAEAAGSSGDGGQARRVSVVTNLTRASRPGAPQRGSRR